MNQVGFFINSINQLIINEIEKVDFSTINVLLKFQHNSVFESHSLNSVEVFFSFNYQSIIAKAFILNSVKSI